VNIAKNVMKKMTPQLFLNKEIYYYYIDNSDSDRHLQQTGYGGSFGGAKIGGMISLSTFSGHIGHEQSLFFFYQGPTRYFLPFSHHVICKRCGAL